MLNFNNKETNQKNDFCRNFKSEKGLQYELMMQQVDDTVQASITI